MRTAIFIGVLTLAACNSGSTGASPAPVYPDAAGGAQPLVTKLFQLLKDRDTAGLDAFLSPAFTLQRADGSSADRADFVQRPADVLQFTISGLTATQTDGVLVARYLADVVGTVNGRPYSPGPAPRLSVFIWDGTDWRLVAHANFNPLAG
jgi:hypothetical protein